MANTTFSGPVRSENGFEQITKNKIDHNFNKIESIEVLDLIKKQYVKSPITFGSANGKKESLLELCIIVSNQIAHEYKDCSVVFNKGIPEIKKVKS
jgi:hypothetical protein